MLVVILLISFFLLLVIGVPISFSLSISSFLAVGLTGFLEWLVQRHGNWYLSCYFLMGLSCLTVAIVDYRAYLSVCGEKKRKRA